MGRISQEAVVTEAFYGRFLAYFTSKGDGNDIRNKASWLHRLPQLSVDGSNNALTLAVQATASSYCAAELHDLALTRHAWNLYGQAIREHSRFLTRSSRAVNSVTLHMISTSVLFSFFEAMQATNADAYRLHVYGTAKMFEVTDPKQCAEGVLCQIFFHIRTQLAFVQLTSNRGETSIDVEKILHDRLDYEELPIFQKLTTHFTALANFCGKHERADKRGDGDKFLSDSQYMAHKNEIEELWRDYTGNELLYWHNEAIYTHLYRDAFTALTVAYFNATRILLGLATPQSATINHDPTDYYQEVLNAAEFMQTRRIGCAYMRIAAPLLIVALHAPVLEQRDTAIAYFESWERGSMRGMSELALETIRRGPTTVGRLGQGGAEKVLLDASSS
jgi:hypothetical protein